MPAPVSDVESELDPRTSRICSQLPGRKEIAIAFLKSQPWLHWRSPGDP